MRLLILGGTADGRLMAEELHSQLVNRLVDQDYQSASIYYSVAGLVRVPDMPCQVISGGFTQFGGLAQYLQDNTIDALLDMTHPYAQRMSQRANEAATAASIPFWRFHRPAWVAGEGDNWYECRDWPDALAQLQDRQSILFTAGQMDAEVLAALDSLYADCDKRYVLRTAVAPGEALPDKMQWIKAIGPFSEQGETELMHRFNVDALVSKNSGGDSTSAKLAVARRLRIPVYMLSRPERVPADHDFSDYDQCKRYVLNYCLYDNDQPPVSTAITQVPEASENGSTQ